MKQLLIRLLVTSPILATLAPQADAAAIAHNPGALSPRFLGRAALMRRVAASVPTGAIKILSAFGSSNEIVPTVPASSVFGGTLDLGTGGTIKTGAGTLSLNGSEFLSGAGSVQISGGLIMTNAWFTGGGAAFQPPVVAENAGVTLDAGSLSISTGVLSVNSGSLLSSGLVTTGAGTLTIGNGNVFGGGINGGILVVGGFNGNLVINGGGNLAPLNISSDPATEAAPAGAPVPEPGSAILFAIGALAASQARRRRAV